MELNPSIFEQVREIKVQVPQFSVIKNEKLIKVL